jgi:hypothetical protein
MKGIYLLAAEAALNSCFPPCAEVAEVLLAASSTRAHVF